MTTFFYNSMEELAKATEKARRHYERDTSWTGGENCDAVITNLRNGGSIKLAEEARKYLDNFNMSISTEAPVHTPSPFGGRFIIPEAILNWPTPARRLIKDMNDAAPLHIYFSNTCSAGIDVKDMIKRGMAIMAFVMAMSYIRPVKVTYFSELQGTDADGWTNIMFDVPTAPMSLAESAYLMGSMSLTRGAVYAIGTDTGNGFHGGWAKHYNNLGGSTKDPRYIKFLREKFNAREDDLIIGSVYLDDPMIKDPVKWIKDTLAKYQGERD